MADNGLAFCGSYRSDRVGILMAPLVTEDLRGRGDATEENE